MVLRKSFYIRWSAGRSPRVHEVNPGRDPSLCRRQDNPKKYILQSSFYWPTLFKDCFEWVKHCDACQRMNNISRRNEMLLQGILVVHIFDVGGNRLHGTLPSIIW